MAKRHYFTFFALIYSLSSCSPKQNNKLTRLWYQFALQYNSLYNIEETYKELRAEQIAQDTGSLTEEGILDIYNDQYLNHYKALSEKLEQTIIKYSLRQKPRKGTKDYKEQVEFNPSIYRAWLLLGKVQFYSGQTAQAEQTFTYIRWLYRKEQEPYLLALLWQCRCLVALGRQSDAQYLIKDLRANSLVNKEYTQTYQWLMAEYYLAKHSAEAVPYLSNLKKSVKNTKLKERITFALNYIQTPDISLSKQRISKDKIEQISHTKENNNIKQQQGKQIYPIDWNRIFQAETTEKDDVKRETRHKNRNSLILQVSRSEFSLSELIFLLASYNFKSFTQTNLQIIPLSNEEEELLKVQIIGFHSQKQIEQYQANIPLKVQIKSKE